MLISFDVDGRNRIYAFLQTQKCFMHFPRNILCFFWEIFCDVESFCQLWSDLEPREDDIVYFCISMWRKRIDHQIERNLLKDTKSKLNWADIVFLWHIWCQTRGFEKLYLVLIFDMKKGTWTTILLQQREKMRGCVSQEDWPQVSEGADTASASLPWKRQPLHLHDEEKLLYIIVDVFKKRSQ